MSSTQVSTRVQSLTRLARRRVRTAIAVGVCAPVLAACSATGFGSPVRHAVANLQAATAKIGANLEVQGVIIALPSGTISPKGGLAYLQFNAINFATQPDALIDVTVEPVTPSGADATRLGLAGRRTAAGRDRRYRSCCDRQRARNDARQRFAAQPHSTASAG